MSATAIATFDHCMTNLAVPFSHHTQGLLAMSRRRNSSHFLKGDARTLNQFQHTWHGQIDVKPTNQTEWNGHRIAFVASLKSENLD